MSRVVPGRPGIVSGLRPLTEVREESAAGLEHLVELRLGQSVPGPWSKFGPAVWGARFAASFRGAELSPAELETLRDAGLERVESLAEVEAEESTFYADRAPDAAHRWGDGKTWWGRFQWADGRDMGVPTAFWELEGDGDDLSPSGNHLTEINSPAYAPAVNGQGAQLTKITDETDSPHFEIAAPAAAFDPGTGPLTVALKVRADSSGTTMGLVSNYGVDGIPTGYSIDRLANDRVRFEVKGAGATLSQHAGTLAADGRDHSIVMVLDTVTDRLRGYVDGVEVLSVDSSTVGSLTHVQSRPFWLGRRHVTGVFDGRMDQVVVLVGRAWSAADAFAYHGAPAGEPPGPNPLPPARWGAFPRVYVHLPGGASPETTPVIAYLPVWLSERAARGQAAVPQFGREKLTDGGFESWLSGTDLEHWTEISTAGFSLSQETQLVRSGTSALRLSWDGSAVGPGGGVFEVLTGVPGLWYRLSGEYWTDPENDALDAVLVRIGNTTDGWLDEDGRNAPATAKVRLERTGGQWRRFYVDVIAHSTELRVWLLSESPSLTPGSVVFDNVSFRPLYAWCQAHPRLAEGSAPTAEVGTNDALFGGDRTGRGDLRIVNADGFAAELLGTFDVLGKEARTYESGTFRDGQEIPADDWRPVFAGRIQKPTVEDEFAQLPLRDVRGQLHRQIPPRKYTELDQPRLDPAQEGRDRPVWLGPKTGISPVRIDFSEDGLGVYELSDTGWDLPFPLAPAGLKAVSAVWAYTSKEAADARSSAERMLLAAGVDYSIDLARGTLTVLRHLGPFILEDDLFLDFDTGGSTLSATITMGSYASAEALAAAVQAAIRTTIGGGDVTGLAEFDLDAKSYRVGRTSGTFNLRAQSGPNRDLGIYALLGFAASADQTGMSSYLGTPVLTDVDQQHVLRVDGEGYADDASGTYTGTANALITKGADVARLLWHRFMGRPLNLVDEPSFAAARTSRPAQLGLYLKTEQSTSAVLETLKLSTLSDIVIDGAGRIAYIPYSSSVPSSAEQLFDRDCLSWSMGKPIRDVYAEIVVEYDVDPATGTPKVRRKATPEVALRAGRPESKTVRTYLVVGSDAQALARDLGVLAAAEPREVVLQLKSRLRDARPGEILRLTRDRALDASGQLVDVAFRVASVAVGERVELRLLELVTIGS